MGIVNAGQLAVYEQIEPELRELCEDVVLARRPDAKNWAPKEVVCHLRDAEEAFNTRFEQILAMDTDPKLAGPSADRMAEERQYLRNDTTEAVAAFRTAKKDGVDTRYGITADNFLHPQYFQNGYPLFQYAGRDPLLIQGQIAQRNFHQETAERLWARAAKLHPNDPNAQVAAAVGRFDMDNLNASFSRLGPLVKRFPRSQTVRYHLGLLLAWTGQGPLALKEFRAARALGPATTFGKEADTFVTQLANGGTKGPKR